MEKRTLAAIALSIVVLFAFRYLEERRTAELRRQRALMPKAPAAAPLQEPAAKTPPPKVEQTSVIQPAAPAPVEGDTNATAQSVVVKSDLYRAVLDSRGGLITSWQLMDFKSGKGQTFEMVAANYDQENRPYPGAMIFDDAALTGIVNREPYEVQVDKAGDRATSDPLQPPVTITLRLRRGNLSIEKAYHFRKDNYIVDLSVAVEKEGKPQTARMLLGEDIGPEHEHLLNPNMRLVVVANEGGKVRREGAPKEDSPKRFDASVRWVGLDMQYFALISIPLRPFEWFEIQKKPVKTVGLDGKEANRELLRLVVPFDGGAQMQLFVGPKVQSYLESVPSANLSEVIDYGMFSILVRPLLAALKWIDRYVHNYGLAIILLTLLLTLLLFPFRLKQMLSMKKMQVVQPRIKEIQERYKKYKKTDPKRAEMNREIMDVYKEHNVNPLGGCLPLILQMPLLFAFYQLLAASIELRQAPFIGWIHDLSMKDPYYVLPIVMGVTMLISQKMTPMTPGTDPTQAKMMMIMPVVFTVMFLNVSSGLNLYFLCSNIFQIGFQKVAERWLGDKRAAAKS